MNTLSNITSNSRHRRGRLAVRTLAAGLLLATAMAAEVHASPTVGTAPTYSGPAPTYGGDPAIGETQESYLARTGDQMPSTWPTSGSTPVFGGDPAAGETDDSYFARTGRHLPSHTGDQEA